MARCCFHPVERRRKSLSHGHQNQLHNFTVLPQTLTPWANTNFAFSGWASRVSVPPSCSTNPGAEQLRRDPPNLKCWHVTDSRDSTGTSQTMFRLRNAWSLAEVVWLSLTVACGGGDSSSGSGVKRRQWRKQRQCRGETALGASFANRRYGQAEADRNALPRAGANSTRRDATTGDLTGPTNRLLRLQYAPSVARAIVADATGQWQVR